MNENDYLAVFSSGEIHFIPREEKETHSTTWDCICRPEKDIFENIFVEKTNCYMHNSIPRGHANRLRMIKLIQLDQSLDLTSQQIEQVALFIFTILNILIDMLTRAGHINIVLYFTGESDG